MRYINKIVFLIIITSISIISLQSQTGTEFWFAAPDISFQHAKNSLPLDLNITAIYSTTVTISRPADPSFTPIEFSLAPQQSQTITLSDILNIWEIEVMTYSLGNPDFVQNKGFLIEADPGEITVYYELSHPNNTDIVALKSTNGLGTNFWVSTQKKYENYPYTDDYSGFVVVATEDGTIVNVDPNGNNLGEGIGSTPFTVNLNKGETFAVRAAGQAPGEHIHGIHVTSNKNIAITIYDDSMTIDDPSKYACWDTFSDQIIPVNIVGKEYIILKGEVEDDVGDTGDGESIFITSTDANTDVYINGVYVTTMASAGDYFEYTITNLSTHVGTSKPVYVNHVTGYEAGSSARELGGAVLPSVDNCTGSHTVTVKRTDISGFAYLMNLMVRNDTVTGSPTRNQAIYNFTYSINGGTPQVIPASHFTYIMDSSFAVYDRYKAGGAAFYNSVSNGQRVRVDNPIARFHLGIMQGDASTGCKYGYFSDYAASDAQAGIGGYTSNKYKSFCNLNPVQLVANGGTSYQWFTPLDPLLVNQLDYDTVAAPYFYPDTTGIYHFEVKVTGECNSKDTLKIDVLIMEEAANNFTFSSDDGCSPFSPILTNNSDTVIGVTQIWTIETATSGSYQIDQDTIPRTFPLLLPENHTDSIQTHTVKLTVKGVFNSCPTTKSKDITVKPQVDADFTASDTIDCHPLFVEFTNLSTGHLDTNSYYWDFGDYSQSFDKNPSKSYNNYSLDDTIFTVRLVTESPYGCTDSAYQDIYVYPRVKANLSVDTASGCSPLKTMLNPSNSYGADTLIWNIDYFYADSIFKTTSKLPRLLQHEDTSITSGPDTLWVQLMAANRFGCRDTLLPYRLVTYPGVNADFAVDTDIICDSVPVLFTNNSYGYQLRYEWDFGDGRIFQDTTGNPFSKRFFNRSSNDTIFTVKLDATSGYFCQSDFSLPITVHPYINADFGLEYLNNCAPLDATITNTSVRSHDNSWDFGDGTTSNTSLTSFPKQFWNPLSDRDTTYTIKLVVQNMEGCSDSLSRNITIYPQVVADFNISDNAGCAPLDIIFSNNSTGALYYLWEFGDDVTSTNPNPNFLKTYNNFKQNDTTYIITLSAVNSLGCDSVLTDSVKILASIDANFSLPLADSCSPFIIRPANLSSSGAKVFEWDFGPLGTRTDFEPVLSPFVNTGFVKQTIPVQLVAYGASDPEHLACADTHTIDVIVYPELDADFALDNYADCQPLLANITNNTNIISGTTFEWRLSNNFYSSQSSPASLNITNFSENDSSYTLTLYGQTKFGCRDTAEAILTAYAHVNAKFTINRPEICSGDSIYIDRNSTSGGITSYQWDFNGESGSSSPDLTFWHSFDNISSPIPLSKYVNLTVQNSHGCNSTWTQNVQVNPKVTAEFTPDETVFCYPHVTQFANNSVNANTYSWNFEDGTSSTDAQPEHQFENFSKTLDNTFNVQLIARSQYNCYDSIRVPITVYAKPSANFSMPVSVACPPFNVETVNYSEGSALSYMWNFAGEGSSSEENPEFIFDNTLSSIADKPITLVVTSDKSCSDTLSKTARVYPRVEADFTTSGNQGCSPLRVDFDSDTANAIQILWYLDGKPFSNLSDPFYRFVNDMPENKYHDIKFMAISLYGCSDSAEQQITVYPSPQAGFLADPVPTTYNTELDQTPITFMNVTNFQNNWEYSWDYGDGNTNNESSAEFIYNYGDHFWGDINNDSEITVWMVSWNSDNTECRDSASYDIIIKPPLPEIDLGDDLEHCVPYTVDFTSTTKYIYEDQYEWYFGIPGEESTEDEPTYTYTEPGAYTVKLVVRGDGGTNWDDKIITVHPLPEVDFTFNDSVVMVHSQLKDHDIINFYNHTRYGLNYSWDFGDGTILDSVAEPTHYYEETGQYYVTLTAVSDEGCVSSLTHPIPITVLGEGYIEFPTGFMVDPNVPHDEYATDQGTGNYYIFYPAASGIEEYHLEIYNRWGVLVFESDDVNRGWNGYIDGKPAKQDVYVWKVKGRFTNGQPFESAGDVTLISNKQGNMP